MKNKYTKKQIQEAIRYWEKILESKELDEKVMRGQAGHGDPSIPSISEFRAMLDKGIVEFEFTKADGTLRHALGTTSEQVIPASERRSLDPDYDINIETYTRMPRAAYTIWFWDLEKNALRCFNTRRFERVISNKPTTEHF